MCLAPTEILKYKNFLKYHTTTAKGLVSLEPWTRPQNFRHHCHPTAEAHGLRTTQFEGERNQQAFMDGDARPVRPLMSSRTSVRAVEFQTGWERGRGGKRFGE
jgi:hypothetical protein